MKQLRYKDDDLIDKSLLQFSPLREGIVFVDADGNSVGSVVGKPENVPNDDYSQYINYHRRMGYSDEHLIRHTNRINRGDSVTLIKHPFNDDKLFVANTESFANVWATSNVLARDYTSLKEWLNWFVTYSINGGLAARFDRRYGEQEVPSDYVALAREHRDLKGGDTMWSLRPGTWFPKYQMLGNYNAYSPKKSFKIKMTKGGITKVYDYELPIAIFGILVSHLELEVFLDERRIVLSKYSGISRIDDIFASAGIDTESTLFTREDAFNQLSSDNVSYYKDYWASVRGKLGLKEDELVISHTKLTANIVRFDKKVIFNGAAREIFFQISLDNLNNANFFNQAREAVLPIDDVIVFKQHRIPLLDLDKLMDPTDLSMKDFKELVEDYPGAAVMFVDALTQPISMGSNLELFKLTKLYIDARAADYDIMSEVVGQLDDTDWTIQSANNLAKKHCNQDSFGGYLSLHEFAYTSDVANTISHTLEEYRAFKYIFNRDSKLLSLVDYNIVVSIEDGDLHMLAVLYSVITTQNLEGADLLELRTQIVDEQDNLGFKDDLMVNIDKVSKLLDLGDSVQMEKAVNHKLIPYNYRDSLGLDLSSLELASAYDEYECSPDALFNNGIPIYNDDHQDKWKRFLVFSTGMKLRGLTSTCQSFVVERWDR